MRSNRLSKWNTACERCRIAQHTQNCAKICQTRVIILFASRIWLRCFWPDRTRFDVVDNRIWSKSKRQPIVHELPRRPGLCTHCILLEQAQRCDDKLRTPKKPKQWTSTNNAFIVLWPFRHNESLYVCLNYIRSPVHCTTNNRKIVCCTHNWKKWNYGNVFGSLF